MNFKSQFNFDSSKYELDIDIIRETKKYPLLTLNIRTLAFIAIAVILLLSVNSCSTDDQDNDNDQIIITEKQEAIIQSSNTFGFEIFNEIKNNENTDKNLFISPLSMTLALGMTMNGAANDTYDAMQSTLGFDGLEQEDINQAYKDLANSLLLADPDVTLSLANSIWYRLGFNVLQPFIDVNKDYFDAEVKELDFNQVDAVDIINGWIENKTNDLIQDVIQEISPQTVMFLINAIYFKGTWKYSFDENVTQDQVFHTYGEGDVTAPTMSQQALLNYHENGLFQCVELPYGDEKFNMLLFLPDIDKTTKDIIGEMNEENWSTWTNSLAKSDSIILYLPKFKIEYDKKLNEDLINLGMGIAFSNAADFSNMTPSSVKISNVIHQSFVEVNEEGTEAAAVTVVEINETSAGESNKITIKFDRPFVFAIYEKSTNAILFLGEVLNPTV